VTEHVQAWPLLGGKRLRALAGAAPISALRELVGAGPVLVLAPHPDDESIGCGGLIAACAAAGIPVFVHFLTDGRHSHPGSDAFPPERLAGIRRLEALRALRILGVPPQRARHAGLTDGTVLFDPEGQRRCVERIARELRRWPSPWLLAPGDGDLHPDHLAAALMARAITARVPRARLLRYFIWLDADGLDPAAYAWTRLAIAPWRARKARAIAAHRSQTTRLVHDVARRTAPDLDGFLDRYETFANDARWCSRSFST
jgi:LmbE family N-acetylglucosaminyl deacetylase